MKTILFIYQDMLLHRSVVDAYVCLSAFVDQTIEWRLKCMSREVREGYFSTVRIEIVDKLDITTHNF